MTLLNLPNDTHAHHLIHQKFKTRGKLQALLPDTGDKTTPYSGHEVPYKTIELRDYCPIGIDLF